MSFYISPAQVYSLVVVKQRDNARLLYDDLTINGSAINLSGSTVTLVWRNMNTETTTRKSATVVTAASGSVSYQLTTNDVADAAHVLCEWEITFGDGTQLTVPTDGYLKLNIDADLDQ